MSDLAASYLAWGIGLGLLALGWGISSAGEHIRDGLEKVGEAFDHISESLCGVGSGIEDIGTAACRAAPAQENDV